MIGLQKVAVTYFLCRNSSSNLMRLPNMIVLHFCILRTHYIQAVNGGSLTEQDVYAAVDSMDILRESYTYFLERRTWRSTPSALGGLERAHTLGVDAMCLLIGHHLKASGAAVQLKRNDKSSGGKKNKGNQDGDN